MGVVEKTESGECCLAQRRIFQREENKSICEVATGAECTFATGARAESLCVPLLSVFVCVCFLSSLLGCW